ncbi:hypothetical protein [Deinococcus sp.]|uniref:hypothetical protein n=1 Tax=Deinococcus sp. TaxID=47478 RepID=UPI003CC525F3
MHEHIRVPPTLHRCARPGPGKCGPSLFLTQADHSAFTNLTGFALVDNGPLVFGDFGWHVGVTVTPRQRAAILTVLRSDLTPGTQLELRKDNFMFGYSTAAFLFGLNDLHGGDRVTFTWIDERN